MNLDLAGAERLAADIVAGAGEVDGVDLLICPAYVQLDRVCRIARPAGLDVGAQDVFDQPDGAHTGNISASMLLDVGCSTTILGHSERRHGMGETDSMICRKLHHALQSGLRVVLCLGETLAEREAGQTLSVVQRQFSGSLDGVTAEQMDQVVVAYEPVWAIGTGKVATPEQAQEVHSDLRKTAENSYNREIADRLRLLYGGSVKPGNSGELLGQPDIDGALVGGASLSAEDFLAIARSAKSN